MTAANEFFAALLRLQPRALLLAGLGCDPEQSGRGTEDRWGQREHATARLEEAVATYREVLQEYPRQRAPVRMGGDPK